MESLFVPLSFVAGFIIAWALQAQRARAVVAEQSAAARLYREESINLVVRLTEAQDLLTDSRVELSRCLEELAQKEQRFADERSRITETHQAAIEQFRAISYEALSKSGKEMVELLTANASQRLDKAVADSATQAQEGQRLLGDLGLRIQEHLARADCSVQELVKARIATDQEIKTQLESLTKSSAAVGQEAHKLRGVLTNSRVRGTWGQLQLKNVVEAAGMVEHCDFLLEESASHAGTQLRPDMRVRLPNQLSVLVDAKVPMAAYAAAAEATENAERQRLMREHAASLRSHIREMRRRDYPSVADFQPALPYTVIFLPNESLFYAAMEADGELLAFAEEQRVILATPLSLIAFLRVVAHGWTQATLSRNALEIREVAQTLNSRICALLDDVADVGAGLESAVRSFNRVVGRRRNMDASFRRLSELGVGDGWQGATIEEIDHELRSFLPSKEPRAGTLPLYVAASEAKD